MPLLQVTTYANDGKKRKGGIYFESPPFAIRFFEDLFRRTDHRNVIPESFGIREQARASALQAPRMARPGCWEKRSAEGSVAPTHEQSDTDDSRYLAETLTRGTPNV